MRIENSYSLKPHNSLRLESTAEYYCEITNQEEAQEAIEFANKKDSSITFLGEGTNVILGPNYIGLVIKNSINQKSIEKNQIHAGGGVNWNELVLWSLLNNLFGLENLVLIPGSVGAAPIQNIGAYGEELSSHFLSLEAIDIKTNEILHLSNNDCEFSYRSSIFQKKRSIFITDIKLKLSTESSTNTNYEKLNKYLIRDDIDPSIATPHQVCRAVTHLRQQVLPNPINTPNVGSFYKNLLLDKKSFIELKEKIKDIPFFLTDEGIFKVPTAFLLERAGWKGVRKGKVGISEDHALVLTSEGDSTKDEIMNFSSEICKDIYNKYSINLEIEPEVI